MAVGSGVVGRGLGAWLADGAQVLVRRVEGGRGGGKRGEVARAVAKLVLDGEGRQAAEPAAGLVLLLKALGQ